MTEFLESTQRPAPEGDSALPQELIAWLDAKDYRPSWQPYNENYLNGLFGKGFEPLPVDWIKDEDPELHTKLFVGVPGVRRLLVDKTTGYIRNFDAVLMVQKKDLWEAMEAKVRDRIAKLEGPAAASEEDLARAMIEMMRDQPGVRMTPQVSPQDPRDFIERAMQEKEGGA